MPNLYSLSCLLLYSFQNYGGGTGTSLFGAYITGLSKLSLEKALICFGVNSLSTKSCGSVALGIGCIFMMLRIGIPFIDLSLASIASERSI